MSDRCPAAKDRPEGHNAIAMLRPTTFRIFGRLKPDCMSRNSALDHAVARAGWLAKGAHNRPDIVPDDCDVAGRFAILRGQAIRMVIASDKASAMAVWRKALFAAMHLNANLPAAYFGVPPAQVVEVGLEVEI